MTPDELRERMIEIVIQTCPHCRSREDCDLAHENDVDALLAAGAAEGWVMPWMEFAVTGHDEENRRIMDLYCMKEST